MKITEDVRRQVLSEEYARLMERAWERQGATSITGQHVQVHKRFLEKVMAYGLVEMEYRMRPYPYAYVHVPKLWDRIHLPPPVRATLRQGGHFMNAVHLGAIEPLHGRRDGKPTQGFYRQTERGREFALGIGTLPAWAHVFHGRCLGIAQEQITLEQALCRKKDHDWAGGHASESDVPLVRIPEAILNDEEPRLLPRALVYLPDVSDMMMRTFLSR